MQIHCGTDIVQIARFERAISRQGDRFLRRLFTARELALCERQDLNPIDLKSVDTVARYRIPSLAARFAGKEAIAKALGTGIGPHNISWLDLEILSETNGAPVAILHQAAASRLIDLHGTSVAISLSHEQTIAQAFCVILSEQVLPYQTEGVPPL
ncbi:MAG: holo-ACP synthase [Eubacteriales bacterium]|nr:holo-ACP synthase [Eubacteriales bacterium]